MLECATSNVKQWLFFVSSNGVKFSLTFVPGGKHISEVRALPAQRIELFGFSERCWESNLFGRSRISLWLVT